MKTKPTKARISRVWIERKRDIPEDHSNFGVIAKAQVVSVAGIKQTLRSRGVWGVKLNEIPTWEKAGLQELRTELIAYGFKLRAIDYAFRNVERKEIE